MCTTTMLLLDPGDVAIAMYSNDSPGKIEVVGYYTIKGFYDEHGIARPEESFEDISSPNSKYTKLGKELVSGCFNKANCWAGGDTLGYVMQKSLAIDLWEDIEDIDIFSTCIDCNVAREMVGYLYKLDCVSENSDCINQIYFYF